MRCVCWIPDALDQFVFFIEDDRFNVQDNLLIVAPNADINFEINPEIVLNIAAFNEDNDDQVAAEIVIAVGDVDDPVESIQLEPMAASFTEGETGAVIGEIGVFDEDGGEYSFSVDDSRFEIAVDQATGVRRLQLLSDAALDFYNDDGRVITVTLDDPASENPITVQMTLSVINVDDPATGINFEGELLENSFGENCRYRFGCRS